MATRRKDEEQQQIASVCWPKTKEEYGQGDQSECTARSLGGWDVNTLALALTHPALSPLPRPVTGGGGWDMATPEPWCLRALH